MGVHGRAGMFNTHFFLCTQLLNTSKGVEHAMLRFECCTGDSLMYTVVCNMWSSRNLDPHIRFIQATQSKRQFVVSWTNLARLLINKKKSLTNLRQCPHEEHRAKVEALRHTHTSDTAC